LKRRLFHLGMFGPGAARGVDWEISHHFEERIDELMESGMSRSAAEAEARAAFGDIKRVRRALIRLDKTRERKAAMGRFLETVWQDIRFGFRGMARDAGFTIATVLTLGLGIGANTAMFGVIDALVLRPLGYAKPAELMEIRMQSQGFAEGHPNLQWGFASDLTKEAPYLKSVMLHQRYNVLYAGGTDPKTYAVEGVTPSFNTTLGVAPAMGRGIAAEDARPGAPEVVVVSHDFWVQQLASDPAVLGRTITLEGKPYAVIGVMPRGFRFPDYSETPFWVALHDDGTMLGKKTHRPVEGLARVAPSELESVRAKMKASTPALLQRTNPSSTDWLGLVSLQSHRASNAPTKAMLILSIAVALILLVAGFNMINLLLVRAASRTRELAIRMAIGAARARIARQLMTEAILMSLLGGVVATAVAYVALRSMKAIMPETITFFSPYTVDLSGRALVFTFVTATICGIVFGIIPAIRAVRQTTPSSDAGLTLYASRGRAGTRLRNTLAVAECAVSVTLLVGAFLLIHSFMLLTHEDPGFEAANLSFMGLQVSSARHSDAAERSSYIRSVEERIEAIPGVAGATIAGGLPPNVSMSFGMKLEAEGRTISAA
jgi:predicted permease